MNPKLKAWINFLTACVGAGLAAYVAAQSAGGNEKAAVIAGVVAALASAHGQVSDSPLEVPSVQTKPTTSVTPTGSVPIK